MRRDERRTAEHARVEVALARPDGEMQVADAPQRGADRRQRLRRVAAVEDERHVGRAGVLLDPVHDRVPADLLLGVDREANVHGQLAGLREELGRPEEHEHVRLVVGHAAGDETPVPLLERPGVGVPELERIGGLHVEVRVHEHGRARHPSTPSPRRSRVGARRAPRSRRSRLRDGCAPQPSRRRGGRRPHARRPR